MLDHAEVRTQEALIAVARIGGFESDAVDVLGQRVRIGPNPFDGILAVRLVNPHRRLVPKP